MKLFKFLTLTLAFAFGLSLFSVTPTFAEDICSNSNIAEEVKIAAGCPSSSAEQKSLPDVIINILNGVIAVSGLVAVVFVIIGGVQYMTSTGDPGKTKKAKDTILYALIGLIVCALSFAIVNFAIKNIIGGQRSDTSSPSDTPSGT